MQRNLLREARQHFNEPILDGFKLCRAVGYAEDDEDCYLIVRHPRRRMLTWISFVGGYTYLDGLKGQNKATAPTGETWDDFTRLDSLLALNGAPKEAEFILRVAE